MSVGAGRWWEEAWGTLGSPLEGSGMVKSGLGVLRRGGQRLAGDGGRDLA